MFKAIWAILGNKVHSHLTGNLTLIVSYVIHENHEPVLFITYNDLDGFQRNVWMTSLTDDYLVHLLYIFGHAMATQWGIIHRKYRYLLNVRITRGERGCLVVVTAVVCVEPPAHAFPSRRRGRRPYRSRAVLLRLGQYTYSRVLLIASTLSP